MVCWLKCDRIWIHLFRQRDYLAHSAHALFAELIEESILPRSDLLDSDVHTFRERAWQLAENLNVLADIVAKERAKSATK